MVELSPDSPARATETAVAPPSGRFRRWLADPAATFLVVALAVGVYLACVVPHFGGIDEPAHFFRAYQISTGRFLPLHPDGSEFSGACVPPDVVRQVLDDGFAVLRHHAALEGKPPGPSKAVSLRGIPRCPDDASRRFVTFSTFGSPVPYLPQAAAIGVMRSLGTSVDGMVLASRLAARAAYAALVWLAIRRATRSRLAVFAVGLVPVALFQASASASHDAVTIALSLLVVSSALRLTDRAGLTLRHALVEATLLTSLLAACKPGYIALSACYLLPLVGAARRRDWWPLVVVPAVGVLVSVLWNEAVGGLWRTDADLFGVAVDPDRQRSLLVHEPWTFGVAAVRTVVEDVWDWGKELVTLGPSVAVWPAVGVVAALLVLALVSVQRGDREPAGLDGARRGFLAVVFVVGGLLVLGAQYVYWSVPGADVVGGMQARFFVPLLVLVPVVAGPRPGRWATPSAARFPLTILLAPVYLAFLITVTFRMY
jgi:hypothetical protein